MRLRKDATRHPFESLHRYQAKIRSEGNYEACRPPQPPADRFSVRSRFREQYPIPRRTQGRSCKDIFSFLLFLPKAWKFFCSSGAETSRATPLLLENRYPVQRIFLTRASHQDRKSTRL